MHGSVEISGMKNAALPIIYGCILVEDDVIIENLPAIDDVAVSLEILRSMGRGDHHDHKGLGEDQHVQRRRRRFSL